MTADRSTHVSFADLPLEGQFLFFMFSIIAMAHLRPWPPTREEVGADLEQIWNSESLTGEDLQDFSRMVDLLKARLGHYAVKDRCAWIPEQCCGKTRRK